MDRKLDSFFFSGWVFFIRKSLEKAPKLVHLGAYGKINVANHRLNFSEIPVRGTQQVSFLGFTRVVVCSPCW